MVDFLNVCNATQVHKRFSTNAQRMHHRCTMDAPWMYNGSTKDARWTHNGCCLDAIRMHHEFIHMYYGCARKASQVRRRCFLNTLWVHQECPMHALRMRLEYFLDVPWMLYGYPPMYHGRPQIRIHHGYTMYSVRMHCLFWSWVIVLGQSCLFIYLFMLVRKLFFKTLLLLQLWTDSFDITQEISLGGPAFGVCSAWRYGAFWRFGDHQQNGLVYSDATN